MYGEEYFNPYFPRVLAKVYRGTLLSEILKMPRKKPISFQDAVNLNGDERHRQIMSGNHGYEPGQAHWLYMNFVKWISDQGYHIELTGDEFEAVALSDKVT